MLPTASTLRLAIEQYLKQAYGATPPAGVVERFVPPPDADPAEWLMREDIERQPADVPLHRVRSFALHVGNRRYPHMKIRLTRPPRKPVYVLSVDAHDAFLHTPPGSPDAEALEQLKRFNAQLAREILAVWDAADMLTEHAYMREQIQAARRSRCRP